MDPTSSQSTGDGNVRVQVGGNKLNTNFGSQGIKLNTTWGSGGIDTIFEPGEDTITPSPGDNGSPSVKAPEKELTLFALRLALLEKAATGLGYLGFIWATVVLLGGYAIFETRIDFWFLTVILLIEGARIFSRSHELEWQHQSTWTIADAGVHSFQALKSSSNSFFKAIRRITGPISETQSGESKEKTRDAKPSVQLARTYDRKHKEKINRPKRTWRSSEVPLLPYIGWFSLSKNISKLLYWLQSLSAIACITLSVTRLVQLKDGDAIERVSETKNLRSALNIFYVLATAEAFLSLLGKLYWEWTITFCKLLEEVEEDCQIGMISIRRFFYDAYAECLNKSIFDGLKLDLVSFATELLASESSDEQLIGAGILWKFSDHADFSNDTLQKIGRSTSVIERLVEMLNWKNPPEAEIRRAAAEILSRLAGKKQNSLRVAGISGVMESISSLLYTQRSSDGLFDELGEKQIVIDREDYEYSTFSQLGLAILKKLARDHDNCEKIGNTKGLLLKIIDFTHTGEALLRNGHETDNRILAVKRSLQVLKLLARTSGSVGKHLRQEIVEIVFTVGNIREILKHGERYPQFQQLGIEILTSLAFDIEAREKIGSTGGIIRQLFRIFFQQPNSEAQNHVRVAAGEAIAMLALESERNCSRILNLKELPELLRALEDHSLRVNSARILRHLCKFAGEDCIEQLKGVSVAAPTVLKVIMTEKNKPQEVMLGLATQVFNYMTPQEASIMFTQTRIGEAILAAKLVEILKIYQYPSTKVPRMRRFAIELAILMMKNNNTVQTFRDLGMEEVLEILRETTSEIESFNIFSGIIGLSRHNIPIHSLVENALQLLADG